MSSATSPAAPRIQDRHAGELARWARLLDEHPDTILRAIQETGPELTAVRSFLFSRQLGLDFEGSSAVDAAACSTGASRP